MPEQVTVTPETVESIKSKLQTLPQKAKPVGVSGLVRELYREIENAINRGYTLDEIAKILETDFGTKVSPSTLKSYMAKVRHEEKMRDTKAKAFPKLATSVSKVVATSPKTATVASKAATVAPKPFKPSATPAASSFPVRQDSEDI